MSSHITCGFINSAVAAAAMSLSSNGVLMNALRLNKMEAELENMGYAESKRGNSGLISDTICIGAIIFLLSVLSVLKKGCLCQQSVIMLRSV